MDVETILNQIRERVVSEENARLSDTSISTAASPPDGSAAAVAHHSEALAQLTEYLTVTGRAWNQLPPVFSNRHGPAARIELWIKNRCKPLTRWFTWEQVNFNRAVHEALSDVTRVLMAEAQELAALRAQLTDEMRREFLTLRSDFVTLRSDLDGRAAELRAITSHHAEYRSDIEARLSRISKLMADFSEESRGGHTQLAQQYTQLANQISELAETLRAEERASAQETDQRLAELAAELKEEQRVCFRQLSLEASEAAILEDRGRRALDARLEKLEKSLRNR